MKTVKNKSSRATPTQTSPPEDGRTLSDFLIIPKEFTDEDELISFDWMVMENGYPVNCGRRWIASGLINPIWIGNGPRVTRDEIKTTTLGRPA